MSKRHGIWMMIGCAVPLLLIFLAPALGLGSGVSFFIFLLSMFACHLLMPMHHRRHPSDQHHQTLKNPKYEHH